MLRPLATATREVICLDGIWNFSLVADAENAIWTETLSHKLQVPVPSSYNDVLIGSNNRDHVGWLIYQRRLRVPRGWTSDRIFIRCDAATHKGRIFIDDHLVREHQGGYTPFDAEITSLVQPGCEYKLTIAVCNELTNETIPPGSIEVGINGQRKQKYLHDFFNYSGLARSVWLHCVPRTSIQDITVTTDYIDTTGVIKYKVDVTGNDATKISVKLEDEDEKIVAEVSGPDQELRINNVNLWQPGAAYLYRMTIALYVSDTLVDEYQLPVGVRTIKVDGHRFLINGKPFYFKGFGKHEDSPIRGKGHDPAYMVHDFELLKWTNANSFRTSHYPYAEEVYDFADRHGIVVIDETAAVGLNLGITSGLFGNKAPSTWSPETMNDKTREAHSQAIRDLIARDKNHPSIVMWCIANEPASHEQGAREYFEPLVALTRSLDSRPICFTNFSLATSAKDLITDLFDVVCINRYYGWYEHTGDLNMAKQELAKDIQSWWDVHKKPVMMTEYGSDTVSGLHLTGASPWSEEFQVEFLETYHRVFDMFEFFIGEHVWAFSDFQTTSMVFRVDGNKKGIFTRDRRPKMAAQTLKKRWLLKEAA